MEQITKEQMIQLRDEIGSYLTNINGDVSTLLDKVGNLEQKLNELLKENDLSAGVESDVYKAFMELRGIASQIADRVPDQLPQVPETPSEPEQSSNDLPFETTIVSVRNPGESDVDWAARIMEATGINLVPQTPATELRHTRDLDGAQSWIFVANATDSPETGADGQDDAGSTGSSDSNA